MTVKELRSELQKKKLKVSGNKAVLQERLAQASIFTAALSNLLVR
jgi:hypothetical protein